MLVYENQVWFLTNRDNKKQLFNVDLRYLKLKTLKVSRCLGDADVVIVQIALGKSEKFLPTIVTRRVDVLVKGVNDCSSAHASPDKPVLLIKLPIRQAKQEL